MRLYPILTALFVVFAIPCSARAGWLTTKAARAGIDRAQLHAGEGRLEAERVDYDCDEAARCQASVHWTFILEPSADNTVLFYVERADVQSIHVDGRSVELEPHRLPHVVSRPRLRSGIEWGWYEVTLPALGGRIDVVVSARLHPVSASEAPLRIPAQRMRHPVLVQDARSVEVYYGGATDTVRARELPAPVHRSVSVRYRRPWRLGRARAWSRAPGGESRRVEASGDYDRATLELRSGAPLPGGPLLGVGVGFGHGRPRPVLRAGWELGSHPRLHHSLVVESDLRRAHVVAATDVSTHGFLFIVPSLSVGVGLPIRIAPRARVGLRTQAAIIWPVVGVVGTFDVFPDRRGPGDLQGAVMLQLAI